MSIESVTSSNHLILCHPLLLLPWIFPRTRCFPMSQFFESGGPKYWNFSFSISSPFSFRFLIFYQIEVWRPHSIQLPFYSLFWVFYQISWVSLSEQRFTDSHSVWFDAMAVNIQTVLYVHAQLNSTLWDPMEWSPLGSSVYGNFQARLLDWVTISLS